MKDRQISKAVIKRLPRYRRYLKELEKKGVEKISSKDLSVLIGYTASQIRQDLNNFGGFGQQGYGYSVTNLHEQIGSILGLDKTYKMVIVGYGRLGQAMASYISNNEPNFHIVGIFDHDLRFPERLCRKRECRYSSDNSTVSKSSVGGRHCGRRRHKGNMEPDCGRS